MSKYESSDISVLHQDDDLIVIDKPAGLMVHRSALSRGVHEFALQHVRDIVGGHVYPVHRLDRATSGVLLFAKHREAAQAMGGQFARREVRKIYRAVVRGYLDKEGTVDRPLERDKGQEKKAALTHWTVLCSGEIPYPVGRYASARYSILELRPESGRRHQLRRHMAHLRHPIIGDVNYGDRHHNHFFRDELGVRRLMLHAAQLTAKHPVTGRSMQFSAPIPSDFTGIRDRLELVM